jgi:hypothetical protein
MGHERKAFTRAEVDRLLEDAQLRAASQPAQLSNWVEQAARAAREVAKGNWDLVGAYWIGLYGTLHELRQHIEQHRRAIVERLMVSVHGNSLERFSMLRTRLDAIERVRRCFDDDDCVYIQFMHHIHSRPVLGSYAVGGTGSIPDTEMVHHLIGKALTVRETNATIDRVLTRRKDLVLLGNALEHVVARDFASVSEEPQAELMAAWSKSERVWI